MSNELEANGGSALLEITDVKRRKGMQYLLFIDGEEYDLVDKQLFDEIGYSVGTKLTLADLKTLMKKSVYRRAKNRAFYLISMREHSAKEIGEKLYGTAPAEDISKIIEELSDGNYINDERYARYKAKSLFERKKYPARRVVQELRSKGIASDIADEVVREITDEESSSEAERAYEFIRRKHKNKMSDSEGRRKVSASLGRYGFSYETVRAAIKMWDESLEDEQEF